MICPSTLILRMSCDLYSIVMFSAFVPSVHRISPSAKRALPVLSKLSPKFDKENEKSQDLSVATAVGEAAVILMATPLLIDRMMPAIAADRKGSWVQTCVHLRPIYKVPFLSHATS